jgi:sugar phosphate isomerase/epimerase
MTRDIDRRGFLGTVGSLGAMFAFGSPTDETENAKKVGPIGLQLYTVRDDMKKDFHGTLAKVARIGYKEVEFAGYFDNDARAVRAALKMNGLTSPSAHIGYPVLGDSWNRILDDSATIGQKYVICPWIDEKLRTIDGYKQVADLFNKAGEQAKKAGLQFGFHNHDYEFPPIDGKVPLDLLITETDPKFVAFEMDVYWVRHGGADPLALFKKYKGRFPLLHLKDMDASRNMVEVGKGIINWKTILEKGKDEGVKHVFVEHDQPKDAFASIRASYQYLSTLRV